MAIKKIQAVIEKASGGGYGIYCPDLEGISLFGYGETEEEAKEDLKENLAEFAEFYAENNKELFLVLNKGNVRFEYKYDFSGFFQAYPVFNVSELARYLHINPSLMRRYKQGLAYASYERKKEIEDGIHKLAGELSAIRF